MSDALDDGSIDFSLGMDSWKSPDRIQPNQYAAGVNVSTRGGKLSPRNGVDLIEHTFEDRDIPTTYYHHSRKVGDIWKTGKFQSMIPYVEGSDEYLITVVSGLLFKTNVRTMRTMLLSDKFKTSQYTPRIQRTYAASAIVLHDYPDYPLIISRDEVKRSDKEKMEVPISVMGTYNHNRLFVANEGVEFDAGDPVGNVDTPDAPLTFIETLTESAEFFNQSYSLNVEEAIYPITAMGFLPEQDSSTGIGPMIVSNSEKIYFYKTNQPRVQWNQTSFGGVLLSNKGIAGQRAHINVNSDLIFMGSDGHIHALSNSRNQATRWGNVPISREVQKYIRFSDKNLTSLCVIGYIDNYVFITVNPYRVGALDRNGQMVTDYAHGGLVVLELEQLASFLSEGTPVWSGLWTGVNPAEVVKLGNSLYILSKDGCGSAAHNALYKVNDLTFDRVERGRKRPVRSIVYTKEYDFKNKFQPKKENTVTLSVKKLKGKFDLLIEKKPSHSSSWMIHSCWNHEAITTIDTLPEDLLLNGLAAHEIKPLVFGDSQQSGFNPLTEDSFNTFYGMQYRLTLTGDYWEIDAFKAKAIIEPFEERRDEFLDEVLPCVAIPLQVEPDWICPM